MKGPDMSLLSILSHLGVGALGVAIGYVWGMHWTLKQEITSVLSVPLAATELVSPVAPVAPLVPVVVAPVGLPAEVPHAFQVLLTHPNGEVACVSKHTDAAEAKASFASVMSSGRVDLMDVSLGISRDHRVNA